VTYLQKCEDSNFSSPILRSFFVTTYLSATCLAFIFRQEASVTDCMLEHWYYRLSYK